MLWPWSAAALPEIMAGAVQESKRGEMGHGGQMAEQQASNWAAPPEREGVERQKPERGLTLRLTVTSRTIIWAFMEQIRARSVPFFHGLHRRFALQR